MASGSLGHHVNAGAASRRKDKAERPPEGERRADRRAANRPPTRRISSAPEVAGELIQRRADLGQQNRVELDSLAGGLVHDHDQSGRSVRADQRDPHHLAA